MTDVKRPSGMPPAPARPAGPQTSDRWGNVISTSPAQPPAPTAPVTPAAPTSDRFGHVISTPAGAPASHPLPPGAQHGSGMPPVPARPTGAQTSDRWGHVISTAPATPATPRQRSAGEIAAGYRGIIVPAIRAGQAKQIAAAPVANPDDFPHCNLVPGNLGAQTDAYVINGKVYAKVQGSMGAEWFEIPNAPIL